MSALRRIVRGSYAGRLIVCMAERDARGVRSQGRASDVIGRAFTRRRKRDPITGGRTALSGLQSQRLFKRAAEIVDKERLLQDGNFWMRMVWYFVEAGHEHEGDVPRSESIRHAGARSRVEAPVKQRSIKSCVGS